MNPTILNPEIQEFIAVNLQVNISKLLLSKNKFNTINNKELAEQIEAKNKCKLKLPLWFNSKNIYYPNKLNIEQTSSETTAIYKANLIGNANSLIDLTGGFGVDILHFAKKTKQVTHCEINPKLSKIVAHNFNTLNINNCNFVSGNGLDYLTSSSEKMDWIYIDPSRRNESKGKVFLLNDCLPNVPENLNLLFEKTNNILIKTSPLLDITQGIKELNFVKEIHVISIKNEVKELLWVLEKGNKDSIKIKTIDIRKNSSQEFKFELEDENIPSFYEKPLKYLFEPNSSILKAGGFNSVGTQLNIGKLNKNSHLYTSKESIKFPGRCFIVLEEYPFNSKIIKTLFSNTKANITTRNFPIKVEVLRKKYKIKDGGNIYLFFTTDKENKKIILKCEKLKPV